jgi:hypothetical protein
MRDISDGAHEATATVHLLPVTVPTPPANTLGFVAPVGGRGLTIFFNAPAAGTYALERLPISDIALSSAVWTEVARQTTSVPGVIAFVDGFLWRGAIYRVRQLP